VRLRDALGDLLGLVDPGRTWKGWGQGPSPDEALGVLGVGLVADALPLGKHGGGASVVHVLRSQEAERRVVMLGVVPAEERLGDADGMVLGRF
jgi:hypothetical protein